VELVRPTLEYLPGYADALRRGWFFDNTRGADSAHEDLATIESDPLTFVARLTDRQALGPPYILPDGTKVPRIPGYRLWMWDGEFCGSIGLRWVPGTMALPPLVLGHIGYGVVPWKQRRGYATRALAEMLQHARDEGLEYIELTTDEDNEASQKVMKANGAEFVERFTKPPSQGGTESLRFRIMLPP
jgi:predicted acetyltransferase